jgi:hypothetical protein
MNPPKLFVITTSTVEYSIYAMDLTDALETFDGDANDIETIAEHENLTCTDTIH